MDWNKKTLADTQQLLSEFPDEGSIKNFEDRMGDELDQRLESLTFKKGKVIYIKATVVDPFFTQLLFSMLYSKSKFDGSDRIQALGIEVESIGWDGLFTLDSREREIIDAAVKILEKFKPTNQAG